MFIIPATRGTRVDIHSLGEFKSQPGQPSETLPQNQIETDLELWTSGGALAQQEGAPSSKHQNKMHPDCN